MVTFAVWLLTPTVACGDVMCGTREPKSANGRIITTTWAFPAPLVPFGNCTNDASELSDHWQPLGARTVIVACPPAAPKVLLVMPICMLAPHPGPGEAG